MDVRAKLLARSGVRSFDSVTVTVDGEPLTVFFRSLTGRERDEFEAGILTEKTVLVKGRPRKKKVVDNINIRAKLIAATACVGSDDPSPLFTAADVEALGNIDGKVVDALFEKASAMAGFGDSDIEELEGN
jgi:hypothetical protein